MKEVWRPREDVQFVFLCGANIETGKPSKRREHLLDFSSKQLPYTKFFLAESIFDVLKAGRHKENILDVENELSKFADHIIIVLESESAFCELGAFASSHELRKKIIVINDLGLKESQSFINLGPIKAIEELPSGENKLLYYTMDKDGKIRGDGIGALFGKLHKLLHRKPKKQRRRVKECDPNKYFTKDSLRFVHDLVYFTNPVYFTELSEIVKILFDQINNRILQKHLALLVAIEQIVPVKENLYKSAYHMPYFEYSYLDIYDMLASFKNMYFRYDSRRLAA